MIKRILNNSFFKSILTLSSGTIIAQIITFIAAPIMTRLYAPEEIGVYTLLFTSVSMFGSVIAGRYDMGIVTEEDEDSVDSLIKLSLFFSLIVSVFLGTISSLYFYFTSSTNLPFLYLLFFITILLFMQGLNLIIVSYNNRNQNYNMISKGAISQSLSKEISMLFFGLLSGNSAGLIFSQVIGRIFNITVQSKNIKTRINKIKNTPTIKVKEAAKKYRDQLIYSVPALFANNFSYSSINIFVENLFGVSTLGFYSISYRVLGIPLTLISGNVSKVYFREASIEFNKTNSYRKTFLRTSFLLLVVAIPMAIVLILISPNLFSWIFGEEWGIAGVYVQILAPMFSLRLIVSPLTVGMIISNKQRIELFVQSSFIISSLLIFGIVKYYRLSIEIYLFLISLIFSIIYILYYIVLFRFSNINNKQ